MGVDPNIVLGKQNYKKDKKDEKNIRELIHRGHPALWGQSGGKDQHSNKHLSNRGKLVAKGDYKIDINGRQYTAAPLKKNGKLNPWGVEWQRSFSKDECLFIRSSIVFKGIIISSLVQMLSSQLH